MKRIQYNPKLKETARRLRNNRTKAEIKLWTYLRANNLLDMIFTGKNL